MRIIGIIMVLAALALGVIAVLFLQSYMEEQESNGLSYDSYRSRLGKPSYTQPETIKLSCTNDSDGLLTCRRIK